MVKLSQTDYEKMVAHAESELPDEACGLIAGRIDGDDKIIEKVYLLTNMTIPMSIFHWTRKNS